MIERYRFDGVDLFCVDGGRWVKYDDHAAEVKRLTADLAAARAERDGLAKALRGVSKSIEAHMYLNDPPADENMDEYDYMMKPLWEAARAALDAPPKEADRGE